MGEKSILKYMLVIMYYILAQPLLAQEESDSTEVNRHRLYLVIKNDDTEYIGTILKQDAREILIKTERLGEIYIPKHEIREIRELQPGDLNSEGQYIPKEVFATRYFLTTNGLPIEKGESYVLVSLYGPEIQFGVAEKVSLGVMTSWYGVPIIGTFKYSFSLGDKSSMAVGTLIGTGSWVAPDYGGILPFAALTFGDRRSNITFSGGYGAIFGGGVTEGNALLSIAAMRKAGKRLSLIFDSFIAPTQFGTIAILFPGIRFQSEAKKAFQFGFTGLIMDGTAIPLPIPMIQWFRKF